MKSNEHDTHDHDHEITEDSPILSAYVLGELDETEHAAFEARLRESPETQRLVDEFREVAGDLSNVFHAEPGPVLSEEQRAEIDRAAQGAGSAPSSAGAVTGGAWRFSVAGSLLALAACAVIVVSLSVRPWEDAESEEHSTVAMRDMHQGKAAGTKSEEVSATTRAPAPETAGAAAEFARRAVVSRKNAADKTDSYSLPVMEGTELNVATNAELDEGGGDAAGIQLVRAAPGESASGLVREAESLRSIIVAGETVDESAAPGAVKEFTLAPAPTGNGAEEKRVLGAQLRKLPEMKQQSEQQARSRAAVGAMPETAPLPDAAKAPAPAGEPATAGRRPAPRTTSLTPFADDGARPVEEVARDVTRRRTLERLKNTPVNERDRTVIEELRRVAPDIGREQYELYPDNKFIAVDEDPRSTFSIDVDTASYANVRRFLNQNSWPGRGVVRIEEMINYFSHDYEYAEPTGEHPFAVNVEVAECPWNGRNRLVRIGLKGKEIDLEKRPPSNFVFLLDVSGSMNRPNKLPLLKQSLRLLVEKLTENDRVAVVVYAGREGLALPSTTGDQKELILSTIENLRPHSGTHASAGIQLAYEIAVKNFIQGGTNRVVLATDGDFNIGITDDDALVALIKEKARSDVFLSVLGFGTGNLKDAKMEKLANNGNGNYSYIDSIDEGRKVLVEEMGGTLLTIAKDVKIQVEFNPTVVAAHRLIGYENRLLQHVEFNDDTKDAGEIGAGHAVTALYEVVPMSVVLAEQAKAADEAAGSVADAVPEVDPLRYQKKRVDLTESAKSGEIMHVKLRYKLPEGDTSTLLEVPVVDEGLKYAQASRDFKFAASVAAFGMILRDSEHRGNASLNAILELAGEVKGEDPSGRREGFLELVRKAKALLGN